MSLRPYAEYKDSGISWLGEIPEHWEIHPLLAMAIERSEPNSGMCERNLLSLSYGRIIRKDIEANDGLLPESFETYQIIYPGDVILRLTDLQNDKRSLRSAMALEKGIITSAYLALQPISANSKYISYLLRAYDLQKVFYSMGGGLRQSMKFSDLKRLPILSPFEEEENAIVAFLYHETAKIDTLIAEQEKLIALLAEKRQAVISHAVTKGLNPDAPMKDSGIPWLGEVPAHWKTSPLRYLAKIGNGSTPSRDNPDYWAEEGFPWLNSSVVNQEEVTESDQFVTDLALNECHLPVISPPTVLIGITGQGKTRGMATKLGFKATINQHLAYISPNIDILSEDFLLRVLESAYENLRTESDSVGSTKGAITCDQISRFQIPLPSLEEQDRIVTHLNEAIQKLEALSHDVGVAITLLKERRSALISSAVTGKIDVRNWQPEASAA
ncbi:restriction endonuclease subunit S [Chromobacterium amazonense]|uniref:restriction endonuclease subunit S n=1 Tax=Chromobacterium amazonense TaxID=1382803 RepID=UPI0031F6F227